MKFASDKAPALNSILKVDKKLKVLDQSEQLRTTSVNFKDKIQLAKNKMRSEITIKKALHSVLLHTNLNKISKNSKGCQYIGNTDAQKMQKLFMYGSQHPTDF